MSEADYFVIRASNFLRHSAFGFRHFAADQFVRWERCRSSRRFPNGNVSVPPPSWRSKIMYTIKGEQLLARLNWRYATKQFDPSLATNMQRRKKCASAARA